MSEPAQSQQAPPTLGEPGEPCGRCGAALAPDQRYCLNCGRRRGEPRVDFRRHLKSEKTAAPEPASAPEAADGAPPTAGGGAKPQRDYAPLAAAGGIAVLGIMLLIGVLIGRGTGSTESSAPPQVVTVGETSGGTAGDGAQGGGDKAAGSKGAKKNTANGAVAGGSAGTGSAPVVSDDALQGLEEQSGESYSDASSKLPDEIATPGAPPPEDNKAPGGGSGGTTIE
jgi:hypothetical protein